MATVMSQSICAIIVTHNIGEKVLETLKSVSDSVDYCVIVDNASCDDTVSLLRSYCASTNGVEMIEHPVNNLARAQNMGIRRAREKGYGWVLLLDHDSTPDSYMVSNLYHAYHAHPAPETIGILVPNLSDAFSMRPARYTRHIGRGIFFRTGFDKRPIMDDVMVAISSGSLIPIALFEKVGVMNEDLCIDNVDYDFCLRVLKHGKKIVAVRDALLNHQLGHCRDHHMVGMRITTTNHSPMRRYYIYRNRLRLWRLHGAAIPAYVLMDVCAIAFDLFKITVLETNKRAKFRAVLSGARDAIFPHSNRPLLPADVTASITK
jgi:rhamnosyltransferase